MSLKDDIRRLTLTLASRKQAHGELLGAFGEDDALTFTLTLPRIMGAADPCLVLTEGDHREDGEGVRYDRNRTFSFPMGWQSTDYREETYTLTLPLRDKQGLYFYTISFASRYGTLVLSYNKTGYAPRVTWADESYEPFALTVYSADYTTPAFFKGGVMYQIFVDRFAKGQVPPEKKPQKPGTLMEPDWENGIPQYAPYRGAPLKNNLFFGGDLYGVAEKLDYLAGLGVTCLYLCPIFDAASNHKYDTGDYSTVDAMFGGDEALELLIAEAKKRNIALILDGVFNHTGDDSRYFNKYGHYNSLGAYQSPDSPYYGWYTFMRYPDSYRSWWGIDILPTVNTRHPAFIDYICGRDGIIRRYLKKGIAGWRLDVADEVAEEFLEALRTAAREEKKDALLLGEVWEDASDKIAYGRRRSYFHGKELDGVMNYPVGNGVIGYLLTADASPLFSVVKRLYAHYPKQCSDVLMNLIGTHDTARILTRLSGVEENGRSDAELATARLTPEERDVAVERLKTAWFLLSVLPGVPCIYYGDEVGMEGYHDPFNRRPFPWHAMDEDLLAFYRQVNACRRKEPLFAKGWMKLVEALPPGVFAVDRFDEHQILRAAVNRSPAPCLLPPLPDTAAGGRCLLFCENGRLTVPEKCPKALPPRSFCLWKSSFSPQKAKKTL